MLLLLLYESKHCADDHTYRLDGTEKRNDCERMKLHLWNNTVFMRGICRDFLVFMLRLLHSCLMSNSGGRYNILLDDVLTSLKLDYPENKKLSGKNEKCLLMV